MIIDLTMTLKDKMKVYEGDPEVSIKTVHNYDTHTWTLKALNMGTHTGTHVDAFSHMHEDMQTLDEISLDRFIGKTWLADKITSFEPQTGLLFKEEIGLEKLTQILKAKPNFVGGNITVDLERALLKHEIVTFTNLINLELLPEDSAFLFIGLPLKIAKGDGSPVRAIAIIND